VVGEGDHARLLLENTTYRQLWEGQQALEAFEPTTLDAPFDDEIEDDEQVSEGVDAAEESGVGGTADAGGAGDASSDAPGGTGDADALSDTDDAGTEPVAKDAADEAPTAEVSAASTETEVVDMPEPADVDAKDVPVTSVSDSNAREADDAKPE